MQKAGKFIIIFVVIIVIIISILPVKVQAQTSENPTEYGEHYDILLEASDANRLFAITPQNGKDFLADNNIQNINPSEILSINIFDIFANIIDTIAEKIATPLTILLNLIGIILLSTLLDSIKTSQYNHIFSMISIICIAGVIIAPISSLILQVQTLIDEVSQFLLGFIPVYVGLLQAIGKPISASIYSTSFIAIIQIISRISATILVPLLGIYLAFCVIGSTSTQINTISIAKSVKTTVITSLSFLLTLFISLLTLQGGLATATDSVTLKTIKFVAGNFLPVVGSAIGDAMTSIQGSLALIKSTIGSFAGIVLIGIFLPNILQILLLQLSLKISSSISETLDTSPITTLLNSASLVLSLILGILLIFATLLILSLGLLLSIAL